MTRPDPASTQDSTLELLYGGWVAAGRRPEAFDALCAQYPQLAPELRQLEGGERLAELVGPRAALSGPEHISGAGEPHEPQPPSAPAGRYRETGQILGRGGMGQVLRVHDGVLDRELALKRALGPDQREARAEELEPARLRRFLAEARITARLSHPNIVSVHDLGRDAQGRPFFTMKLVEGRRLDEVFALARAGRAPWSLPRAIEVLVRVCEALAHAHSKRVVHRDLKPANVLVGPFGEVYVIDWGLARELDRADERDLRLIEQEPQPGEPGPSRLVTVDGHVLGTPVYMSPEQARGDLREVGPASDIYALGAMLYELLADRRPYHRAGESPPAALVLARVLAGPPQPLRELAPGAPPELESIAERAMARVTAQRYADMGALAEDLRAWLEGRVVRAHASGAWPELRKWIGRHRGATLGAAASLVLAAFALIQGLRLSGEVLARELSEGARLRERDHSHAAALDAARLALEAGDPGSARLRLERAPAELRGFEWELLHDALPAPLRVLVEPGTPARALLLAPQHGWLALAGGADLRFTELLEGATAPPARALRGLLLCLALDPNGRRLAVGSRPGPPLILDLEGDAPPIELVPATPVQFAATSSVAFSPDGTLLASAHLGPRVRLWSMPAGEELEPLESGQRQVFALAFAPDGGLLAAAARNGLVLFAGATFARAAELVSPSPSYTLAWSPDGTLIAAAGMDGVVRVWSPDASEPRLELAGHRSEVMSIAWSGDGAFLVSGDERGDVRLWSSEGRSVPITLGNLGAAVVGLGFLPTGELLAVSAAGAVVELERNPSRRLSRLLGRHEHPMAPAGVPVFALAFDPTGRTLASGADESLIKLWNLGGERPPRVLAGHRDRLEHLLWSADGERLWSASADGRLGLWDALRGERIAWAEGHGAALTGMVLLDAERVLSSSLAGDLRMWDARDGAALGVAAQLGFPLRVLALSPGARQLAGGGDGGELLLLDARSFAELQRWSLGAPLSAAAFLGEEELLVGCSDGSLHRIDCATGQVTGVRPPGRHPIDALRPSPDGSRLALVEGELALLDGTGNTEFLRLPALSDLPIRSACWSSDGRVLALGSMAGEVLLLEASSAR